ncbi:unnamed protein product, partial [Adineta steineri]
MSENLNLVEDFSYDDDDETYNQEFPSITAV